MFIIGSLFSNNTDFSINTYSTFPKSSNTLGLNIEIFGLQILFLMSSMTLHIFKHKNKETGIRFPKRTK